MTTATANIITTYVVAKAAINDLLRDVVTEHVGVLEFDAQPAVTFDGIRPVTRVKLLGDLIIFETESGESFHQWEIINATDVAVNVLRNL